MIRHASRMLFILLIAALAACSSGAGGAARPGHKLGDLALVKGGAQDVTFGWQLDWCSEQAATCPVPIGTRLNLSMGLYPSRGTDLETLWAEHTYEMTVNGTPVDIKSFGYVDIMHPVVGKMRFWNVAIAPTKPVQVQVHSRGVVGGEPFDYAITYEFTQP